MSAAPLVHIGFHKTASTWFQKELFPLVEDAWLVPRKETRLAFLEPRVEDFDPELVRRRLLKEAAGRRIIVSEENLSGYPHNGGVGGALQPLFAQRIAGVFPEATIVIFLRAQSAAIAACYGQYVRSGGASTALQYVRGTRRAIGALRHWYKVAAFDMAHFRYSTALATYEGLFERQVIKVFLYEEFNRNPVAFLARFCAELELAGASGAPVGFARNVSLSPRALPLMRILNRFTRRSVADKHYLFHMPGLYKWREDLARWLMGSAANRPADPDALLGRELRLELEQSFAEDNARVSEDWNLDFAEHGYVTTPERGPNFG